MEKWTREALGVLQATSVEMNGGWILTFATSGNTCTRAGGSWLTDGFAIGDQVTFLDTTSNNVTATISGLSATVMTVTGATFVNETTGTAPPSRVLSDGHINLGLPGGSYPSFGLVRVAQMLSGGVSRVLAAFKARFGGASVPVLSISQYDEIEIGGTSDAAAHGIDTNGDGIPLANKPSGILVWTNYWLQRANVLKWQDDSGGSYETKWRNTIETTNATPQQIPLASSLAGETYTFRVRASAPGSTARWDFVEGVLVYYSYTGSGNAWTCTSGGLCTGVVGTTVTWRAAGGVVGGPLGFGTHNGERRIISAVDASYFPVVGATTVQDPQIAYSLKHASFPGTCARAGYVSPSGKSATRTFYFETTTSAASTVLKFRYIMADEVAANISWQVSMARATNVTKRARYRGTAEAYRTGGANVVLATHPDPDVETTAGDGLTVALSTTEVQFSTVAADSDVRTWFIEIHVHEVSAT